MRSEGCRPQIRQDCERCIRDRELDGWTTVTTPGPDQPQYDFVTNTPGDVLSGSTYALSIGPVNAEWSVYQNISTVPGDTYQVQFWLSNPAGGTPSNFTASFGAATLVSLSNSAAQNYTEYTYDVTATGTSTELLFVGEQNPAYWYLDDVSVVDVSRVGLKGTKSVTIESGATLELGASDSQIITFATDTGTLKPDSPSTFTGQILGFTGTAPNLAHSDAIDLVGFDAADTTVSASTAGGITTLTVTNSSGDGLSATLKLVGTYSTSDFVVASDGDGGTDIFDPPVTGQTSGTSAPPVAGATSGTSATLGFALGNDQINLDPGQIETKSYDGPLGGQGPGGKPTVSLAGLATTISSSTRRSVPTPAASIRRRTRPSTAISPPLKTNIGRRLSSKMPWSLFTAMASCRPTWMPRTGTCTCKTQFTCNSANAWPDRAMLIARSIRAPKTAWKFQKPTCSGTCRYPASTCR